jgi:hypothetical protein
MNRRSFLSVSGIAPLLHVPLWGQESAASATEWGPPKIRGARGELRRAVVSFTPVRGAATYTVRCRSARGETLMTEGVLVTDYTIHGLVNGQKYSVSIAAVGPNGTTAWSEETAVTPGVEMDWRSLEVAFAGTNPTRSSCPFWMVHGNESDDELRRFLDVAYRFGFEGVTLHPYNYQDFLGDGEWNRWKVIVEHSRKLGLAVWQQDDRNYPSGYAAGTIVQKDPSLARWEIALIGEHRKEGPAAMEIPLAVPEHQRLVSVSAFGPGDKVEDLSAQARGDTLRWNVPDGAWTVYVTAALQPEIHPPASARAGRREVRGYIDPLSEKATDLYVDAISGATFRHLGDEFGRTWKGFFIDEPGFYNRGNKLGQRDSTYPYTPDFLDRFQRKYGYSIQPLMPALWISHGARWQQVRRDYMDFVGLEYSRLFIGKLTKFAESHGIQLTGHVREDAEHELGAGTGGDQRTLEYFSMGGFDHIFDQWYGPDEDVYWRQPKMASSVSHYLETPQDEATVEHFAATGWRTGLTEMKAMMDWTTCRGLNHIVPCGLDTQNPPVWEDAPEFWLHGANPLTPYFHVYQTAANRETMMIRGGRHVAKALVLDPAESSWAGQVEALWKVNKALSQAHFDYDNVSYYTFADSAKCRIEGKRILLGHEDYEVVVLPGVEAVPLNVLERMRDFYAAGGTVLIVGPEARLEPRSMKIVTRLPFRSTDGKSDAEVSRLAAAIWGPDAKGPGRAFISGYYGVSSLLYSLGEHDVWVDPNLTMLQYYHRRLSGRDLYFFNNEGEPLHTEVRLSGAKGVPEMWNPVDGAIGQAACYRQDGSALAVRLDLERFQSVFIVVNPAAAPQSHVTSTDADFVCRTAAGKVSLRKYGRGLVHYSTGTGKERTWETPARDLKPILVSDRWTRTPADGNAATYSAQFDAPGVEKAELRISGMTQVVHGTLNGRDLGMRFAHPFSFDLATGLKAAGNQLELRHVERYTFTSTAGVVSVTPYYSLEV